MIEGLQQRPVWPYMIILAIFFLATVMAPRAWKGRPELPPKFQVHNKAPTGNAGNEETSEEDRSIRTAKTSRQELPEPSQSPPQSKQTDKTSHNGDILGPQQQSPRRTTEPAHVTSIPRIGNRSSISFAPATHSSGGFLTGGTDQDAQRSLASQLLGESSLQVAQEPLPGELSASGPLTANPTLASESTTELRSSEAGTSAQVSLSPMNTTTPDETGTPDDVVLNAASIGRVASVGREDDLAKVETSGITRGPKLARHGTSPEAAGGEISSRASARVNSESVAASEPVVRRVPRATLEPTELAPSSVLADVSLKANVYQQSPYRPVVEPRQTYWQRPDSLLTRLDGLSVECATNAWASDVSWTLVRLSRLTKDESETAGELLRSLHVQLSQADKLLLEIDRQDLRSTLQRTKYALQRRLAIWDLVIFNSDALAKADQDRSQQNLQAVANRLKLDLRAVDQYLSQHSGAKQWNGYLLLDALRGLAFEPQQHPTRYRQTVVRKVLQRTMSSRLSEKQLAFLSVPVVLQLQETLRNWSNAHLASSELLKSLEIYESSTLVSDAQSLAEFNTELLLSSRAEDRQLAMRLQEKYHNANFRLSFSDQLLKRLIPSQPAEIEPVRDTIVSVPVRGHSMTDTELSIHFLPDRAALRFLLQAQGQVFSRTTSSSGPVVFKNVGHSAFESNKLIIVASQGIRVGPATAVAESDNTLFSVSTDFDSIPLVGTLVREVAISQHDAKRDAAHREVVSKLESRASSQFDRRVSELLAVREQEIKSLLFQPLEKLQLPLHPLQMQTTEHRAVVRLRVANDYQLGSHTPRPQAPSDSLASLQVHQSVVNNFLDRLELGGKWFDLAGLHKHVSTKLGHGEREPPQGLERDVYLRFDKLNPVSVRFEKGLVNLTLRFEQLRNGRRRWNDVEVRVAYRPVVQGLSLALRRESKPVVKMQRVAFGNRVALHGIFGKVFPSSQSVQLTHETFINNPHLAGTSFTQCVMVDGWLGIALAARGSVVSAHVARRRATQRGSR